MKLLSTLVISLLLGLSFSFTEKDNVAPEISFNNLKGEETKTFIIKG